MPYGEYNLRDGSSVAYTSFSIDLFCPDFVLLFAFLIRIMMNTTIMIITVTASEEITDICIIPKDSSDTEATSMSSVDGGIPDDNPEDKREKRLGKTRVNGSHFILNLLVYKKRFSSMYM